MPSSIPASDMNEQVSADSIAGRGWKRPLVRIALRHWLATLSGLVLLSLVGVVLLAPVLPIADPNAIDTPNRLKPPFQRSGHPLGTDGFGRDMVSRLVWGGRISLMMGLTSALLSLLAGVFLGLISGYGSRRVDTLIMRGMDILMAFPFILLAIALVAALGPGLFNAMLAIAVVGVPQYARLTRSCVLTVKEREFVESAAALGANDATIMGRHILPNITAPIIVMLSLDVGAKIIATASLSFLGLGTQPPTADWGSMLAEGRNFLAFAPHVATLPGLLIFVVAFAFNLLGDGLRDVLDPRLRM